MNREIKGVERGLDLLDNQVMNEGFNHIMSIMQLGFGDALKIITKSDINTLPFVGLSLLIGCIEECYNYLYNFYMCIIISL